ncbi:MAG: Rieske (2Fe-2S) protein [Myxococcota bacterium]|nr:Rieske (2Fe-2S) protein [Myxococcota bacterium]
MVAHHAASYRRTLDVSIDRIWENALDWEHLPHLHASTFATIDLIERRADPELWRARVEVRGLYRQQLVLELRTDRPRLSYVTRTLAGFGRGTEVRTTLQPRGERSTDIVVEFHLAVPRLVAPLAGVAYRRLYDRLWSEDLVMMRHRQRVLDAAAARRTERAAARATEPASPAPHVIGLAHELRARTPLLVTTPQGVFRVVSIGSDLHAHTVQCPHLGGPLDAAAVVDGVITCPWHGYQFDVVTGRPVGAHRCRLSRAPAVEVDAVTGEARLVWAPTSGAG